MFHAATAYLPSSFAMYTAMLGAASFMDRSGKLQTARGVEWFAAGALLGWPFAAALVAPYVALEAVLSLFGGNLFDFAVRLIDGAVRSVGILVCQCHGVCDDKMLKGCVGSTNWNRFFFLSEACLCSMEHCSV
jgi:alpha-1,2-mannosyltransferase